MKTDSNIVYRIFKKGEVCLRCGISKKEANNLSINHCSNWGIVGSHEWNKKKVRIKTILINIPEYIK